MQYTFVLCPAHHRTPKEAKQGIFPETVINPSAVDELREIAENAIPADCTELVVYVTGLTPAMLAVVAVCVDRGISLTAMHYNPEGGYYPQQVTYYVTCLWCGNRRSPRGNYCPVCGGN